MNFGVDNGVEPNKGFLRHHMTALSDNNFMAVQK